ncbi:MAG: fused MFS/spermidine synthase [Anaerolineales bacterium]|nr:fused MFS/spermidine synthase [Anaerolineales bacterium]
MKKYLYFTVFVSGMTTLGIEFAASRLLGSVFGTSNLVWASIIGLILIYLTIGYFIGGKWADRSPRYEVFYSILVWGAFTAGLVPFIARPVLYAAADAFDQLQVGVLLGAFTAVLVLLIVPITLLGTISPFAIRLVLTDSTRAGQISGQIYAISTLGSFLGTFTPDLVLIPWLGTRMTFVVFSLFLMIVGLIGLGISSGWRSVVKWIWMPVLLIGLGILWGSGPVKKTADQIYEKESSYNYIQVLERDGYRYLRLNEGQGIHSIYHPEQETFWGTWMQVLPAPFFNPPPFTPSDVDNIAIIGLAAGTTARQATSAFGSIPIDGFEIDREIIEVGQNYFDMTGENLVPIAQDGRWGLAHSGKSYSIISIDAYRPPYIPWHLTTKEFFTIVYDHLDSRGALVINVGRTPEDEKLLSGLTATIQSVFPSVFVMDVPGTYNSIIYATVQATETGNLAENLALQLDTDSADSTLVLAMRIALENLRELPEDGQVFTDNKAPIEWITNQMVLNNVLSGSELLGEGK